MLKKTSLFLLATSLVSCATVEKPSVCRHPQTITRAIPADAEIGNTKTTYTVGKGDSLWRIAKKYDISVEDLLLANSSLDPHDLKIGQKIFIPTKADTDKTVFLWPVEGKVINFFGENVDGICNNGINIATASNNTNVKAAAAGTVIFANKLKGWGTTIIIKHYPNTYTVYANLDESAVSEGQNVSKGANIAKVATGKYGNYVLHFEIREKSVPSDPLKYLN